MTFFAYKNHQLQVEDLPLSQIADQFGTPCYVYSRAAIEQAWHQYADVLGEQDLVCYAVKANSNLGVLSVLAKLGSGFDIVSVGELERVLRAGGDPAKVVFSGVGKQADEMRRALEVGIHCFNVESVAELQRLNEVAGDLGKKAPVSIRVNPDVDAKTHPYISTGLKENKFGIDISSADSVYQLANSLANISVIGVDCHIGSQILELDPFFDALDRLLALIDSLADKGIRIQHLDLGGGVGVQYRDTDQPPSLKAYMDRVRQRLGDRSLNLVVEPGRSIVANAGVFLTRVEYLKQNDSHNFAIVDGAMNDLIRPTLYSAWQQVLPVKETSEQPSLQWDLVGPICETGDFLAKDRTLSLEQGDLLAIMSAGAYGFVMASNYNTRNRVPELLVDGEQCHLVRRRETLDDQLALETVLSK